MRPPKPSSAPVIALLLAVTLGACGAQMTTHAAPATPAKEESTARLPRPEPVPKQGLAQPPKIRWRHSIAVGSPSAGSLIRGVQLPARGGEFSTWDANLHRSPNRAWRRWGTARLIRLVLAVARDYRAAHPRAGPLLIGDLSRPHGGNFGRQFGYVWHASHQNGLDVDIYYPRRDRARRAAETAADIDHRLSQDIVNRLVRAGATKMFVGPGTGLTGPSDVVQVLADHDDHVHVRIAP
jgi:murein endopeptidase